MKLTKKKKEKNEFLMIVTYDKARRSKKKEGIKKEMKMKCS